VAVCWLVEFFFFSAGSSLLLAELRGKYHMISCATKFVHLAPEIPRGVPVQGCFLIIRSFYPGRVQLCGYTNSRHGAWLSIPWWGTYLKPQSLCRCVGPGEPNGCLVLPLFLCRPCFMDLCEFCAV
jgi:hypothetical protein